MNFLRPIAALYIKIVNVTKTMREHIRTHTRLALHNIDEEEQTIRCCPEKRGDPRMFKVSAKLIAMLIAPPKTLSEVFGAPSLNGHRWNFTKKAWRLAQKLQNPRLEQITFHTFGIGRLPWNAIRLSISYTFRPQKHREHDGLHSVGKV